VSYDPRLRVTRLTRCPEQVEPPESGQRWVCEEVEHHPGPHKAVVAYGASTRTLEWYLPPS
jgi:hypothetical protein